MKKFLAVLVIAAFIMGGAANSVSAQRMSTPAVKVIPKPPKYRKPPMPARGYVWIAESWQWERNRYVFIPGYWQRPPARYAQYVQGRWDRTRYGYVWTDGYWTGRDMDRRYDERGRDPYYRSDERYNRDYGYYKDYNGKNGSRSRNRYE